MSSLRRMGVLYGRLGLATDASLIERRANGVQAAVEAIESKDVAELVRMAFGLPVRSGEPAFLTTLADADPTFDVRPADREAALLAGSTIGLAMEEESDTARSLALAVTTAAFITARAPLVDGQLVAEAEAALAKAQGETSTAPADRTYQSQPDALKEAIEAVPTTSQYFQHASGPIVTTFKALGSYAQANALASARNDNVILSYVRRLEQEMRVYWWASGGWSREAAKPFRDLGAAEAALRAGKELAERSPSDIGLFAAPALIDMVLSRGRELIGEPLPLADAAVASDRTWRRSSFATVASGMLADLLPVSTALGAAAESEDADDWKPRFERLTRVGADTMVTPIDLGIQLYRERLLERLLAA